MGILDGKVARPIEQLGGIDILINNANGGGSIINMASSAAKRWDGSDYGVYAAVK